MKRKSAKCTTAPAPSPWESAEELVHFTPTESGLQCLAVTQSKQPGLPTPARVLQHSQPASAAPPCSPKGFEETRPRGHQVHNSGRPCGSPRHLLEGWSTQDLLPGPVSWHHMFYLSTLCHKQVPSTSGERGTSEEAARKMTK